MADSVPAAELRALIALLEDPSDTVQGAVRARLAAMGRGVMPRLRAAREVASEPHRSRIAAVIAELHLSDIESAWSGIMHAPEGRLERGAWLLALYNDPELDIDAYRSLLDEYADRVRPALRVSSGLEAVQRLVRFFVDDLAFRGNRDDYYDPENSYLNRVIDRRLGIPISLSVVMLLLARRLNLAVHGVNMPAHFLLKSESASNEVFIDLFNGGLLFTRQAAEHALSRSGITPDASYFAAAPDRTILLRMVRNLVHIARERQDLRTENDLMRLLAPWDQEQL